MCFTRRELIQFGEKLMELVSEENKAGAETLLRSFVSDFEKTYEYEKEVKKEAVIQKLYYVAALPEDMQEEIRQRVTAKLTELGIFTPENLENAMSSRLCDLERLIETREYIQRIEEEQQKKAAEQGKGGRR